MTLHDFYRQVNAQRANILKRVDIDLRGYAEDILSDAVLSLVKNHHLKGEESVISRLSPVEIHAYLCGCVTEQKVLRATQWLKNRVYERPEAESQPLTSILDSIPDERDTPEEALLKKERMHAFEGLTAMQSQVLTMVQSGMSTREIARTLGIAQPTVVQHVTSARKKISA